MNRICDLFQIQYPIVQGGMIWCSGWRLASAVSNAGGLGLLGAGSMHPETLRLHIQRCKEATTNPFGVNVPMLYPQIEEILGIIVEEGVKIVFTSAGNPKTWTPWLKERGITVVHVVPGTKFAQKSEAAGVDAVVVEGFEAGGHNGREETTTIALIPNATQQVSIPVIAAGGIGSGRAMFAAMALGAEGVQIGSRFAVCEESSAHPNFKQRVLQALEGETRLTLKKLAPVRLLDNPFAREVIALETQGADEATLQAVLGRGRAKKGMFEGSLEEGELEIGQVSSMIHELKSAGAVIQEIVQEFQQTKQTVNQWASF